MDGRRSVCLTADGRVVFCLREALALRTVSVGFQSTFCDKEDETPKNYSHEKRVSRKP